MTSLTFALVMTKKHRCSLRPTMKKDFSRSK